MGHVAEITSLPAPPERESYSVASLKAGDPGAVAEALHGLLPSVRRWAFRFLGPRPDVDDAVQDILVALASSLPRFEGRGPLEAFARRIAMRVIYRYFRRRRPETSLDSDEPVAADLSPESELVQREALTRLYRCLDRIPPKCRVAFVLCAIEGMEPSEAARVERVSPVAMRSRYMRARRELARRLGSVPNRHAGEGEHDG